MMKSTQAHKRMEAECSTAAFSCICMKLKLRIALL